MKLNHLFHTASAVLLACALWSCDSVGEDERLIEVERAEVRRSVLIEDFTGQRCVNCPTATAEIEKLQEEYGKDAVIAVAIHSGPFGHNSTMNSARLPLCTETGDEYYTHWGIEAQPAVKINRGTPVYSSALYGKEVRTALEQTTPVDLHLVPLYDPDTRTVQIDVEAVSTKTLGGKVQVWITENNIVDAQMMPDGSRNPNYLHQHVFRTSLTNDLYGDDLRMTEDAPAHATYQAVLSDAWKAEDIVVVAFVTSSTNGGVLQVVQSSLTPIE